MLLLEKCENIFEIMGEKRDILRYYIVKKMREIEKKKNKIKNMLHGGQDYD